MNQAYPRIALVLLVSLFLFVAAEQEETFPLEWPVPGGKVGKAGKNLQVLPYDDFYDLLSYMQEIQESLSTSCVYCHNLDDFALDDNGKDKNGYAKSDGKNAARTMIRMVYNLNAYIERNAFILKAVGVAPLRTSDIKDPISLATKLREAKDPVSQYLRECLPEDTRKILDAYDGTGLVPESLQNSLIDGLNQAIRSIRLYDKKRFGGVELTDETKTLAEKNLRGEDLVRLNQLLVLETYPKEIVKTGAINCMMCHRGTRRPSQQALSDTPIEP
ncbi:MAG: hypothetical protein ABIH23_17520 [bacterium]